MYSEGRHDHQGHHSKGTGKPSYFIFALRYSNFLDSPACFFPDGAEEYTATSYMIHHRLLLMCRHDQCPSCCDETHDRVHSTLASRFAGIASSVLHAEGRCQQRHARNSAGLVSIMSDTHFHVVHHSPSSLCMTRSVIEGLGEESGCRGCGCGCCRQFSGFDFSKA